jgi:cytochrome c554/c'-like protein
MSRNRRLVWLLGGLTAASILAFVFWRFLPPTRDATSTAFKLRGSVVDDSGVAAGVRVRFQGQAEFTQTDAEGRFVLPAPTIPKNVTAWKPGHFIGFAPSDSQPLTISLRKLPGSDDGEYRWIDPAPGANSFSCGNCHEAIFDEWRGSAHGRPGETSRFRDLFLGLDAHGKQNGWSLIQEHPDGTEVCASCHNPAPLGKSNSLDADSERNWGNVHCDFCHKIAGASSGEIGLAHGRRGLELLRPHEGQLIFGPLDDAARRENAASPFQRDSRFCASCHEGVVFGVSVYTTYSEWQASPAARGGMQCQDCHMKPTGKMTNLALEHGGVERDPATLANHRFFDPDQRAMLTRCLKLKLEYSASHDAVRAVVTVAAIGVGHRVPTGLPDRNLALVVEALDSNGNPLAITEGPILPSLTDPDAKVKAGKLFAKVLKDFDGRRPVPFWRAAPEYDDTRLEPDKPEKIEFNVPAGAAKVTAKLVYRRFWPEVTKAKGWADDAWVIVESSIAIAE